MAETKKIVCFRRRCPNNYDNQCNDITVWIICLRFQDSYQGD